MLKKERHKEARGLVIIEVQQSPQGRDTGKARLGLDGSVSRRSSIGRVGAKTPNGPGLAARIGLKADDLVALHKVRAEGSCVDKALASLLTTCLSHQVDDVGARTLMSRCETIQTSDGW